MILTKILETATTTLAPTTTSTTTPATTAAAGSGRAFKSFIFLTSTCMNIIYALLRSHVFH